MQQAFPHKAQAAKKLYDADVSPCIPCTACLRAYLRRYVKRELPRYIPVASELYSFLQDNSMPRTLPDGRTESPGVLRIYM